MAYLMPLPKVRVYDAPVTVPVGGQGNYFEVHFDDQGITGSVTVTYRNRADKAQAVIPDDNVLTMGLAKGFAVKATVTSVTLTPSSLSDPVIAYIDVLRE